MNVAAVDIGTNSVRLLVTDAAGTELERRMRITRLGQGVDRDGALGEEPMRRTVAVLAEYGAVIRSLGAGRTRVTATSAARDASNRDVFFDAAERALGTRPELISGEEEARLSFMGATTGLDASRGPFLVIDVGGGSTEFVLGTTAPSAVASIDVGCVRLTERHLRTDPPRAEELEACFADVREGLERVRRVVPVGERRVVVGLAGTITTLAALSAGLSRHDATVTHHRVLTLAEVTEWFARLAAAPLEERRRTLIEPERAEVIVAGAAIVVTLMRELQVPELVVSEKDILDGLAASIR